MCLQYESYRLDELGTVVSGATPSTKDQDNYDGDIPWITPKDLSIQNTKYIARGERNITKKGYESCSTTLIPKGSIIMSTRAPIGYLAIAKCDLCTNQGFKSLVPNSDVVDSEYLYYALLSQIDSIKEMGSGTTFPEISKKVFGSITVNLPPIQYQKETVKILNLLDSMILINDKINDYLVQISNALYDRYFPYSVYDDLPDGWKKTSLGQIIEIHDSKRIPLSAKERSELAKIYPYYGAASITDYVNDYIFDGIYLLLGEDGTVINDDGSPVLQYVFGKFWVNNHAHILTGCKGYSVDSLFLLCQRLNITSIVTGAVQPKISQSNLRSLPIVQPPIDSVESFSLVIKPLFDLFRVNSEEIKLLTKIRNQLITELFRGSDDNK